ncbi:ATP-binding cassette domain-containing protein [Candidatus Marinimicrobia bacterium]|jgi:peptide/nickel transport system ATP-binding protein|nr:ATP-binding cassette domain-containing protein [Candidatus Neomarinimicrobiota bacterium]|tara:strand:- start:2520 stop:3395 length:876 start_codon:yes stop_codon:yes gene_type:complete
MSKEKPILRVRGLTVDFPFFGGILQRKVGSVHAVKNVSFDLIKGETLGIVGESGSGKSTLGNAILNVLRLTSPEVQISGNVSLVLESEEVEFLHLSRKKIKPYRKHIQMIFQDPYSSLNPRMLVKDIIQEPLDINTSFSQNEKKEKVEWLLDKVGLTIEQSNRYPHEFSGGQRQRIAIARSLATDPKVIIADESVSALDVSIQAQIINLMMDLQEELNLSIIFIAHDLSVVKHISNRVGVMYAGELVEINKTDNIFNKPEHDYTKELLRAIPQPDPAGREERKKKRISLNK